MKTTIKIGLLLSICIGMTFFFGCKKSKIKKNCCKGSMVFTPANYLSDSVAFYLPNAFTPDGDGINDYFVPAYSGITAMDYSIYKKNDRIFLSSDMETWWDGKYKEQVKTGIYKYVVVLTSIYGQTIKVEGEFCSLNRDILNNKDLKHCEECTFSDMLDPVAGFIYFTAESFCD